MLGSMLDKERRAAETSWRLRSELVGEEELLDAHVCEAEVPRGTLLLGLDPRRNKREGVLSVRGSDITIEK